nr:hypothetical protein [Tanacetum cinerariifolium]
MADLVFTDHVSTSLDHAPSPPQQDILMTDATTKTTAPEPKVQIWRDREGKPTYEFGERSSVAQIHPVTRVIEYDVETLQSRVDVTELQADILQLALRDAGAKIVDLRTRMSASESSERCMITCFHRMEKHI